MVPAQLKALFDSCVALWVKGELMASLALWIAWRGQEVFAMSTTRTLHLRYAVRAAGVAWQNIGPRETWL
ncbi:Flavoprotein-like domain [Phytophthora cactorum]|nr:Flavoprotein-like domain [Phytophthora cactorum]